MLLLRHIKRFASLYLMIILSHSLFAGSWYEIHENLNYGRFNDAVNIDWDFKKFYAVGDNGKYYISDNGGYDWSMGETGVAAHLMGVDFGYFYQSSDSILIAAGENGTVLRHDMTTGVWDQIGGLPSVNYHTAAYYSGNESFWVGGDGGSVYYSYDAGQSWQPAYNVDPEMQALQFLTYGDLFLLGFKNDTTFINRFDSEGGFYSIAGDTIPGIKMVSGVVFYIGDGDALFLAGNDVGTGDGVVWQMNYNYNFEAYQNPQPLYRGVEGTIADIDGYTDYYERYLMWISTAEGQVWESKDYGQNWRISYSDPQGRQLGPIATFEGESYMYRDYGRVMGENGLVLKYGFELLEHIPHKNKQTAGADRIDLRFSGKPDLQSIRSGVHIRSNISGTIPFIATYDSDSTQVFLDINHNFAHGSVPGEKWNISLSDNIKEADTTDSEAFYGFNYDVDMMPNSSPDFDFKLTAKFPPPHPNYAPSTHITGFFNEDDGFDILTFSGDTLYCYSDNGSSVYSLAARIPLGIDLTSNPESVLQSADFNRDGKPDLLIHDDRYVYIVLNTSSGQTFAFAAPQVIHRSMNIRQILTYNANDNEHVDLLVLNDTLFTRFDVTESGIIGWKQVISFSATDYSKIRTGDVNVDGVQDLAVLKSSGSIALMPGEGDGYFYTTSETDRTGYFDLKLADLNRDAVPEVLGATANDIEIYPLDSIDWNFVQSDMYVIDQPSASYINDFIIHDFGGGDGTEAVSKMDLLIITSDSVKFFENRSFDKGPLNFSERPEAHIASEIFPYKGFHADFNKDAFLDFAIYGGEVGQLEMYYKNVWTPEVDSVKITKHQVYLEWLAYPFADKTVDYFAVARDSTPDNFDQSFQSQTGETFYYDNYIHPFASYWYAVRAVFQDGTSSVWSEPVYVKTYFELQNTVTGVINDSSRYYMATTPLSVPADSGLIIEPGIEIGFLPGMQFDVYGGLEVRGNNDEQMVSFFGLHDDYGDDANWYGITLHPSADTVRFDWFSVRDALTGIAANNRPLKMHLGGMSMNEVALNIQGDQLLMKNVALDSNLTAMQIGDNSRTMMRNVNITHTMVSGIEISGTADVEIRNAVMWYNMGPAINSLVNDPARVRVSYSTIDSLQGLMMQSNISKLEPIFMPPDSGYYRPDYLSPTIDAGDPNDPFMDEPEPNGRRINQGLFGGTWMATASLQPNLEAIPRVLNAEATIVEKDTIELILKNSGFTPLEVNGIEAYKYPEVFILPQETFHNIAPQDSIILAVVFQPQARIEYADTMHIYCNDPHYQDKGMGIPLYGLGLNSPPVLTGYPPLEGFVNEPYFYQIQVSDADNDSIIFNPLDLPEWLKLSTEGILSGTPAESDTGLYPVRIEISDGYKGVVNLDYQIDVYPYSSTGLVVVPRKLDLAAYMGKSDTSGFMLINNGETSYDAVSINLKHNSQVFIFMPDTVFALAAGDSVGGKVIFTPQARIAYKDTLLVNMQSNVTGGFENAAALADAAILPLSGVGLNSEPVILETPLVEIHALQLYSYQIQASDDDGDTLYFEAVYIPEWLTLSSSGLIRGRPSEADTGQHEVIIDIIDGHGGNTTLSYLLTVLPPLEDSLPPRVRIRPLSSPIVNQAAVQLKFFVRDTAETQVNPQDAKVRVVYYLEKLQSEIPYEIVDTTHISEVLFYPLTDGNYKFKLWAYDQNGNGLNMENADSVFFKVAAWSRSKARFFWHMIALPKNQTINWESFGFEDSSAVLYRWNSIEEEYEPLKGDIYPGTAFWMLPLKKMALDLSQDIYSSYANGASNSGQTSLTPVQIQKGWNQIGVPVGYDIRWNDAQFFRQEGGAPYSFQQAVAGNYLNPAVYWFRQTLTYQGYEWTIVDSTSAASPWVGYWLKANADGILIFPTTPAFEADSDSSTTESAGRLAKMGNNWQINLALQNDKYKDRKNILGMSSKKQTLIHEPPHFGDYCALYFPSSDGKLTQKIAPNFKSYEDVKVWDISIDSRQGNLNHTLEWEKEDITQTGLYLFLVDLRNETVIDMQQVQSYAFRPADGDYQFKVYASQDAAFTPKIIPLDLKLAHNYPNPFNPETTIRFGVPESAAGKRISLVVYDVLGRQVKKLYDRKPASGYMEVQWDGTNEKGEMVASGIYFYKLRSPERQLVKKMLLVR